MLKLVNDKTRVVSEEPCDGAGSSLVVCRAGALAVKTRETAPFNKAATYESAMDQSRGANLFSMGQM